MGITFSFSGSTETRTQDSNPVLSPSHDSLLRKNNSFLEYGMQRKDEKDRGNIPSALEQEARLLPRACTAYVT